MMEGDIQNISSISSIIISVISGMVVVLCVYFFSLVKSKIIQNKQINSLRNYLKSHQKSIENVKLGGENMKITIEQARFAFYKAIVSDARLVVFRYKELSDKQIYDILIILNQEQRFIDEILHNRMPNDLITYNQFFDKFKKLSWLKFN